MRIAVLYALLTLSIAAPATRNDDMWEEVGPNTWAEVDANTQVRGASDVVDGYTCSGLLGSSTPCSTVQGGGTCGSSFSLSGNCHCTDGYFGDGYRCDWGPQDESQVDIEWTAERVQRVSLAVDIASSAYWDQDEISTNCPTIQTAFGDTLYARDLSALTTEDQITEGTDPNATRKDTQAVFGVLQADYSPSGEVELVAGFRGTEFSRLTNGLSAAGGIMSILGGNLSISSIMSTAGSLSDLQRGVSDLLLTDLDIRRYDLQQNGTSLGYVHQGVYDALYPYINWTMGLVFSEIGIQNGIEGLRSSDHQTQLEAWSQLESSWDTLTIPKITITGHSLGAGLATAFAAWIKNLIPGAQIYLYSFASLRIGSPKFASMLEAESSPGAPAAEIIRFANQRDAITMVPTNLLDEFSIADITQALIAADNPLMHVGKQVTLDWDQVPASCQDFYISDQLPDIISHLSDFMNSTSCWYAQDLLDLHRGYTTLNGVNPMQQWLSKKGYTGSQMCRAGAM